MPDFAHDKHTNQAKRFLIKGTADRWWDATRTGITWRKNAAAIVGDQSPEVTRQQKREMTMDDVTWDEGMDAATLTHL